MKLQYQGSAKQFAQNVMNKFCAAPWVSLSTDVDGSARPCCRYSQHDRQTTHIMPNLKNNSLEDVWNSDEFNKLRKSFIDGEYIEECNWCYDEEESGIVSYREKLNKKYPNTINLINDNISSPKMLDLKLSNSCNLKCRICSAKASSTILAEFEKFGEVFEDKKYWLSNKIIGTDNENNFTKNWLRNLDRLELTGGEPLQSKENKKLIDIVCSSEYVNNIDILITTNTTVFSPRLNKQLKKFKSCTISMSIDDIDERFEFSRKNAKWETAKRNIINYNKLFMCSIYCTISNYNVFYLNDIIKFANDHNIRITFGVLHEDEYNSIKYLNTKTKNMLFNKYIDNPYISNILNIMLSHNTDLTLEFLRNTHKLDWQRAEDFNNTFPEWSDILYDSL